jgi:hypothetical protein
MERADTEILNLLERELLDPAVIAEAIDRVRLLARGRGQSVEARRVELTQTIGRIEAELVNLTGALAGGVELSSVVAAIRERETHRTSLTRELDGLGERETIATLDARLVDRKIDKAIREWHLTIRKHVPQARQMIGKPLKDRITFTPETNADGRRGWAYRADGSVSKLLPGVITELSVLPQALASPTGFEPVFWP